MVTGISCMVTGDGDSASPEQVDPWRQAARAAVALIGTRNQISTWEAIVGVAPRLRGPVRPARAPARRGPVHLVPGGTCMRELVPSDRTGSAGYRHTFPLIASGQFISYEWGRAALAAEACLRRTCALLSLLTGALWVPQSHPSERATNAAPLQVPPVFGTVPPFPGEAEWRGQIWPGTPEFTLPGWIEQAWPALDADAGFAQAVNAVYEGMRLEPEHPSLAHLTFVAVIEGYGMRLADDAPVTASPAAPMSRPPPRSDSARHLRRS